MISNHVTSSSKPLSSRLEQQSSLLPSKVASTQDLLESKTKDKPTENRQNQSGYSLTNDDTKNDDVKKTDSIKASENDSVTTNEYDILNKSTRSTRYHVRSKTPPPSRNKAISRGPTSISPLRQQGKASPVRNSIPDLGSRSISPIRPRVQGDDETKRILLSPKRQQRSERNNRPSFQGLSVIDGKRKNIKNNKNDGHSNKIRNERRRKSLNLMRNSAQSEHIREILESTMDDYHSAFVIQGTAEERLQTVMTKAKEKGMSVEDIFKFFNGGNPNTTHISKDRFLKALEKLGDTFVVINVDELNRIVKKFDHNQDGKISIDEFKNYCYEIPAVPWKAEKKRLEKSGELRNLKAQLSRRFKFSDIDDGHSCGEEVFRTSKFFWKTNNNVEIRLYYSEDLNVITVQLYSQTFEKELPLIYVCKNKVEFQLNKAEKIEVKSHEITDSVSEETKEKSHAFVSWETISKYIVTRMKLKLNNEDIAEEEVPQLECAHIPDEEICIPFLCKLSGDTFDTLMIQKPLNLNPPPSMASYYVSTTMTNTSNFEETVTSFQKDARKARESRQSAEGLTNLVASALSEAEASF